METEWEDIRADWVNGNRTDVYERIHNLKKSQLLELIQEALSEHFQYWDIPKGTHSGDLTDLREIISGYLRSRFVK